MFVSAYKIRDHVIVFGVLEIISSLLIQFTSLDIFVIQHDPYVWIAVLSIDLETHYYSVVPTNGKIPVRCKL